MDSETWIDPLKYRYAHPEMLENIDGLIMVRGNGSSRYLTIFESLMYRLFKFYPRDCITHKRATKKQRLFNWNVFKD